MCRPSCGHLANIQGYGGYGPDNTPRTPDDPHIFSKGYIQGIFVDTCAELNTIALWGFTDWFKIPLIEGAEPHEVFKQGGGECCARQ